MTIEIKIKTGTGFSDQTKESLLGLVDKIFPLEYDNWSLLTYLDHFTLVLRDEVFDSYQIIIDSLVRLKYNNNQETQMKLEVAGNTDAIQYFHTATESYLNDVVRELVSHQHQMNISLQITNQKYNDIVCGLMEFNKTSKHPIVIQ